MIELRNLCKTFVLNGSRKVVADQINTVFPDKTAVAILGRNGAGKSSLLKMIAGSMDPDSGEVVSTGTISWPVGFAGSFHPEMTGLQNVRFIARVYGVDSKELAEFVRDFAEVGPHFNLPVRTYSSGMKSRLAFGVSMGIHFDTYLVDEVTAVGDAAFREKSDALFAERVKHSAAIMVTHGLGQVRKLCHHAAVLEAGHLHYYTDIERAIAHHQSIMRVEKQKTA
ncbi:ABC transporter ATP-binding protein [uncultured Roseovarius sp.]|uniref:ABC transporter ATP-binding protein n=1 Tax=uncultured Roseovarius sp. TaxID=293344 RepID=UPI002618F082|nr:ABC transporter ATP-binding protein [uncultured Roseovarius sp.]